MNITIAKLTNPSSFPDAYLPLVDTSIVEVVDVDLGVCIQKVDDYSVVKMWEDRIVRVCSGFMTLKAAHIAAEKYCAQEHTQRAKRVAATSF